MAHAGERYRVGFDIGGTFTDFVLVDAVRGEMRLHKCLTTPEDPSAGALAGLDELLASAGIGFTDIHHLVHGTTLVTNAVIERRGARVALLTTRGFRDVLEMRNQQRYDKHDLFLEFPEPLVPRALRLEVDERVDRDGGVVVPLDPEQCVERLEHGLAAGAEAIAVCFLHAYENPAHERAARELIASRYPELPVSLSSEVNPELREYERVSTTVANAYVQPRIQRYLGRMQRAFEARGFRGRFHLAQSSGGLLLPEVAARFPVRLLESGPAGGALASAHVGAAVGRADLISFDMGGTTAKACLIQDGTPDVVPRLEAARTHRFKRGSGLPIRVPVVDLIEVGAGGGSIARIDEMGLLRVGPRSAGAAPGPACYGLGGDAPTVTDANLLLGYLDPEFFLGGRMALQAGAAAHAVAQVAQPLGLDNVAAAWGIHEIVSESMAAAARGHIVEKGRDPRRYAMVGMGGAGPAHASRVARILGVEEVLIPPASGAASALGFLIAPIHFEQVRSWPVLLESASCETANTLLAGLESEGRQLIENAGVAAGDVAVTRSADMRLQGQNHEIRVPLPGGPLDENGLASLAERFVEEYTRLYTHVYDGARIQVLNWHVRCEGPPPSLPAAREAGHDVSGEPLKGSRQAYFPEAGGFVATPVYDRYRLVAGTCLPGPAIIEEYEATTVIAPGDQVRVDEQGNLCIAVERGTRLQRMVPAEMPLEDAVARIEADPIALEIMWRRLINIAEECWDTVIRTAFSLIIGEAQDFACEILDAQGNQLAHSSRAMPSFSITLPIAVNAMLERYPPDTLAPGDVLVTNDPWVCAGHLNDIAIATPVFRDGTLVAIVGAVGHVTDIGGTKDSLGAREVYEEGLQIPPMKLMRGGEPNDDLLRLLAENVRGDEQVLGDVHALVSANASGARRILEFMDEYGMDDLRALTVVVQRRSETAMRDAVRALPDGVYEGDIMVSSQDVPERFPIRIHIRDESIDVDYAGTPPQTARGADNSTLSFTTGYTYYPLKCMLTPEVPSNAGCYRAFSVSAPQGSRLNATRPAAVYLRTRTTWYCPHNVLGALARAAPDRVQAFTGFPSSERFYGRGADGRVYDDHLFQGGGQGAWFAGDGKSGLLYPTTAADTSVELMETRAPVLVLARQFVADSGGAGRHRGGLGQIILCRKLYDDGLPTQVRLYPAGVGIDIPGLDGGHPGGPTRARVLDTRGAALRDLGGGGVVDLHDTGQITELLLAGGSGYGDPLERAYESVQADLDGEYITAVAAERDYGCTVGPDGRIDVSASDRLRTARRVRSTSID